MAYALFPLNEVTSQRLFNGNMAKHTEHRKGGDFKDLGSCAGFSLFYWVTLDSAPCLSFPTCKMRRNHEGNNKYCFEVHGRW